MERDSDMECSGPRMGSGRRLLTSAAQLWRCLPSSLTTTPLLLLLLLVCSVRVSQCSEECSGQFLECLVHINSSIRYTDNDQLHTSCTEGELHKGPLCIQRVMDECEEAFDVAPDQMAELRDQQKTVQDKFQHMCAEFLKLHPSASSATSGARTHGVTWGSRGVLSAVLVVLVIPQWALSS
ncbi:uncharacterized protein [Littorina saxatilis]|uniref:Uncharacterized protein n=1 Tax=Littorina saxatilis TaxID=31220 RepID=A0AAN9BA45_9CAEN